MDFAKRKILHKKNKSTFSECNFEHTREGRKKKKKGTKSFRKGAHAISPPPPPRSVKIINELSKTRAAFIALTRDLNIHYPRQFRGSHARAYIYVYKFEAAAHAPRLRRPGGISLHMYFGRARRRRRLKRCAL